MRILLFEDQTAADFGPIALTRPVFDLVCGRFALRERLMRCLSIVDWGAYVRSHLREVYREEHPDCRVNDFLWLSQAPTLVINGRWLPDRRALQRLIAVQEGDAGVLDDQVVYLLLDPLEAMLLSDGKFYDSLAQIARGRRCVETSGRLVGRPWDLISHNQQQLLDDFQQQEFEPSDAPRRTELGPHVAVLGAIENVSVSPWAEIEPFVTLDARRGPISIEPGAVARSFTRLEGPCHIGRESQLFRAEIRGGTTIGPVCRVGGEIEASILHSHVNKYHDGFLGHSYVCPWVNLGAQTTNSDLKNDYSNVRVPLAGEMLDTGSTKVGCFIGDHTKTALGSLFNTGSSIGVMCMILPGGRLLPKHIPPFSRVWHGQLDDRLDLSATLSACRAAMHRRNCEFTSAQERLYHWLFDQTAKERQSAIKRNDAKPRAPRTP
jgi:UDP-N-acetylglucosamine diphosphorylase / glucose-1-phosphate thymidylyltransferase / UDP-N-acetylgalactosamine diphosphorylase / glucosamine-1-phosphate N-acetyltransferase / galactosamine-1-phosphate N-acetyltransferase